MSPAAEPGLAGPAMLSGHTVAVRRIVAGVVCALLLGSCARRPNLESLFPDHPHGVLRIFGEEGQKELAVAIAGDARSRAKGLAGVQKLPDDAGMVFVFDRPSSGTFWMRDVSIPLDIAFWDGDRRIVDLFQMQPCRADPCPVYSARAPYVGAVETNRGVLTAAGIKIADKVRLIR